MVQLVTGVDPWLCDILRAVKYDMSGYEFEFTIKILLMCKEKYQ